METNRAPGVSKKQMFPIMLTAFITPFMGSALNLSIPSMSAYFSAGAVSVGWVITAYYLSSTALLIPFGKIADLYGKKKLFLTGILLFGIFSLLSVFAWSIGAVILFRLGQGIGASMIFATNTALVASNFPVSVRGKMMGLSVMCTYLGLSVGPVLGGLLNRHFGWRSIFVFSAGYCVLALVTALFILEEDSAGGGEKAEGRVKETGPEDYSDETEKFSPQRKTLDLPGCILFTMASGTFLYGLSNITTSTVARMVFLVSFFLIGLFIRTELKTEEPVLDLKMFTGNRAFTLSNAAALLNYGASSSISYLLSVYLQNVRGFSSDRAGLILIATPILQAALSPLAGRLSDRYSPYRLASLGMLLTCAGIVLLIFTGTDTPMSYLILSQAIIGMGFALFSSPNSNAIMSSADRSRYGVASSIMSASRTIGQTASMAIVNMIIGAVIGNITLASASAGSIVIALKTAFIVNAVLCGIGVYCSASRQKI